MVKYVREIDSRSTWAELRQYVMQNSDLLAASVRNAMKRIITGLDEFLRQNPEPGEFEDVLTKLHHAANILDRISVIIVPEEPDNWMQSFLDLMQEMPQDVLVDYLKIHGSLCDPSGIARVKREVSRMAPLNNDCITTRLRDIKGLLERCGEAGVERAVSGFSFTVEAPDVSFPPSLLEVTDKLVAVRAAADAGLDEIIDAYELVISDTDFSLGEPGARSSILFGAGTSYYNRNKMSGLRADLDAAIECYTHASELEVDEQNAMQILNNLAHSYGERYRESGDLDDLDLSIVMFERIRDGVDAESEIYVMAIEGLASSLRHRYIATGRSNDLQRARELLAEANLLADSRFPDQVAYCRHNLGVVLLTSYLATGIIDFLKRSVVCHRESVAKTERDHRSWPVRMLSLGNTYRHVHESTGDEASLERSIGVLSDLLGSNRAGVSDLRMAQNNMAAALVFRYQLRSDSADLDEAVQLLERVVDSDPPTSPLRAGHLVNLGNSLVERYELCGDSHDLDRAIALYKNASIDSTQRELLTAAKMNNLANALRKRYEASGSVADSDEAVGLYRRACVTASVASDNQLGWRSSVVWGQWAAEREAWAEAVEAYSYALPLMTEIYRRQLTRDEKRQSMRDVHHVASDIAFAYLMAGDDEGAVMALEEGRCLWLNEMLGGASTELAELSTIDPVLHGQWVAAQVRAAELEKAAGGVVGDANPAAVANLQIVRSEIESLASSIRKVPGFEDFLLSPGLADVMEKAAAGPIVYLLTTRVGGFALVVDASSVRSIPLPDLQTGPFGERVQSYFYAEDGQGRDHNRYLAELDRLTEWLWTVAVSILLSELEGATQVVLIPVGIASFVPWHAAWEADTGRVGGRKYWMDHCLITYSPSAKALPQDRRPCDPTAVLAVANPAGSPGSELPWALLEAEGVAAAQASQILSGEAATPAAIFNLLERFDVLHIACHGRVDIAEPLASSLFLANGEQLTVGDILEKRLNGLRLVVLSACDSAFPSMARLHEEAVGFPASFMQAGVAGVVGSLWPVSDMSTGILMRKFYEYWRNGDGGPAEALRAAQMWLRDVYSAGDSQRYSHPYHWAGFVCFGA